MKSSDFFSVIDLFYRDGPIASWGDPREVHINIPY